jgi:acid phosphatase type 7
MVFFLKKIISHFFMTIRFFIRFFFLVLLAGGASAQNIVRGPFLQMGSSKSMVISWNTDTPAATQLYVGEEGANKKLVFDSKNEKSTQHTVALKDLKASTKYFYQIGEKASTQIENATYYFFTSPPEGSKEPFRMVAFGDCGTGTSSQREVYSRINRGEWKFKDGKPIAGWLLLGDNAYNYGFDDEYQKKFFDVYHQKNGAGNLLHNAVLWPTPGNHDYGDRRVWPNDWGTKPKYFDIFSLPTKGECGGVPSNSEAYYAFNYANVHFVSLDSYGLEDGMVMADSLSKQVVWLKKDLALNTLPWVVVYFHHPPYTKGSHDSDLEGELVRIRENLVKVLERYKVDLVLGGHSHNYERSFFMHNHFGNEASFDKNKHALSSSSGRYDGSANSCPYIKSDKGTVYVVAGTAGWVGGTSVGYPHNAMAYSNSTKAGALVLDVEDNRLDVSYVAETGEVLDKFTMMKAVNKVTQYTVSCGEQVSLMPSWKGSTVWNGDSNAKILKVDSLVNNTQYWVRDKENCLKDEFKINVSPFPPVVATSNSPIMALDTLRFSSDFKGLGQYFWKGPDGFSSDLKNPEIVNVKPTAKGVYTFTAKYKNCVSISEFQVDVLEPLGLSQRENKFLLAFPNPSFGQLGVRFYAAKEGNYRFLLYDRVGHLVLQTEKYFSKAGLIETELNFEGQLKKEQIYLLRVSGNGYTQAVKIVGM